jgi:nucleoside-diphosphate-sugar epimerase
MRVLITGISGFIGFALAEKLLSEGHEVAGIDKRPLPLNNLTKFENFKFVQDNLLNNNDDPAIFDVDVIFHLAGQSGVRSAWGSGFKEHAENNILATQIMLENAKKYKVDRFFYASSSSVYGNSLTLPVDESGKRNPNNPYGISKMTGEDLCTLYSKTFGLKTTVLRFFTIYGPRQRENMLIQKLINNAANNIETEILGDGIQSRDFLYIDDLISALSLATITPQPHCHMMNIGSGKTFSVLEVINILEKLINSNLKLKFVEKDLSDVVITHANISSIKATLDWTPTTSFLDGVRKQWEYTQENLRPKNETGKDS